MPSWSVGGFGGQSSGCSVFTRQSLVSTPPGIPGLSLRMTSGFGSRGGPRRTDSSGSVCASPSSTTSGGFDPLGSGSNGAALVTSLRRQSAGQQWTSSGPFGGIGLAHGCRRLGRRRGGDGMASRGGMRLFQKRALLLCGAGTGCFVVSRARLWGGCIIGTQGCGFLLREAGEGGHNGGAGVGIL
jgi:hypothetical protein